MVDQIFVGRDDEIDKLQQSFDQAYQHQTFRVCFITGDAGSGKTTLVEHFAEQVENKYGEEVVVAIGKCNAQTGPNDTYLPFREIISQFTGIQAKILKSTMDDRPAGWVRNFTEGALEALIKHGPDLIGTFVPGSALIARLGMSSLEGTLKKQAENRAAVQEFNKKEVGKQYSDVIIEIAKNTKVTILIVDDLQWADEASLQLFAELADKLQNNPIMLLGTYRAKDTEEAGLDHPLNKYVLNREFWETKIDLRESNRKSGRQFVEEFLKAHKCQVTDNFQTVFFERTEGNALFVVELFRYLTDNNYLVTSDAGEIVENDTMDWSKLPAQLTKLEVIIAARFQALNADLRRILDIASIEGQEFTAQVVLKLLNNPDVTEFYLLKTLFSDLEKKHNLVSQLRELPVGSTVLSQFRFVNSTFHQYLYNDLSLGQRRILHREVAETLEDLYSSHTGEIANQLAWHYDLSYMPKKVVQYLNLAAVQLAQVSEHAKATELFNQALSRARVENDRKGIVDSIRFLCGEVLIRRSTRENNDVVKKQLLEALDLARNINHPDYPEGYIEGVSYIYWRLGMLAGRSGHFTTATKYYLDGIALAEKIQNRKLAGRIMNSLGVLAMNDKAYEDAKEYFNKYYEIAKELNDKHSQTIVLLNLGDLDWRQGDLAVQSGNDEAARGYWSTAKMDLHKALQLATENITRSQAATAEQGLADVAISEGEYTSAKERLYRGLDTVTSLGENPKIIALIASTASLLHKIGDIPNSARLASFVKVKGSGGFSQERAITLISQITIDGASIDWNELSANVEALSYEEMAFEVLNILSSTNV